LAFCGSEEPAVDKNRLWIESKLVRLRTGAGFAIFHQVQEICPLIHTLFAYSGEIPHKKENAMHRSVLAIVLCLLLLSGNPGAFAQRAGSKNGLNVTVGEPTVYSLEQAHYILEKNRRQNASLESALPGTLDPNQANTNQLDLLRTVLSISGEYDQAAGISNRLALKQYTGETTPRRKSLEDRQDAARAELTKVNQDLAVANSVNAQLVAAGTDAKAPEMVDNAKTIAGLQTRQTSLTNEIASLETSLKELRTGPTLSGVSPGSAPSDLKDLLSKDALTAMMNKLAAGPGPSLAASLRLENYVQMQQELIAKQLTLLRDEAGPTNRVLFLELPQSIFATGRASGQVAQTWFRVTGLYSVEEQPNCLTFGAPADDEVQDCNPLPQLSTEEILRRASKGTPMNPPPQISNIAEKAKTSQAYQLALQRADTADAQREIGAVAPRPGGDKHVKALEAELRSATIRTRDAEATWIAAQNEINGAKARLAVATTADKAAQDAWNKADSPWQLASGRYTEANEALTAAKKAVDDANQASDNARTGTEKEKAAAAKRLSQTQHALDAAQQDWNKADADKKAAEGPARDAKLVFERTRVERLSAEKAAAEAPGKESAAKQNYARCLLEREQSEQLYRRVRNAYAASEAEKLYREYLAAKTAAEKSRRSAQDARRKADDEFLTARMPDSVKEAEASELERNANTEEDAADQALIRYNRRLKEVQGSYPMESRVEDPRKVTHISLDTGQPNRQVRTIDLVPKQSAFIVNALSGQFRHSSFSFLAKTLTFGLAGSYERNRELINQFQYQQAFAWGFGKGERTFGWTFGALPGTKQLNSGVRTTYAVMIVPKETQLIELEGRGCWMGENGTMPEHFPAGTRDENWPERITERTISGSPQIGWPMVNSDSRCGPIQQYLVRVPGQEEGFELIKISYTSVEQGERATLHLYGSGLSPQAQVFVNGTPLKKQTSLSDAGGAVADGVDGGYEWVNSSQIAMSFSMGSKFKGTPTITLVTPAKSAAINYYSGVQVNNTYGTSLSAHSRVYAMFKAKPEFQVGKFQPTSLIRNAANPPDQHIKAYLTGKGFHDSDAVLINGAELRLGLHAEPEDGEFKFVNEQLLLLRFTRPESAQWTVTVQSRKHPELADSVTIDDPYPPVFGTCSILNANTDQGKRTIEIRFEGNYLNGKQKIVGQPKDLKFLYRPSTSELFFGLIQGAEATTPFQTAFVLADGSVETIPLVNCVNYVKALKGTDYKDGKFVPKK
jgi:hypothetical protein